MDSYSPFSTLYLSTGTLLFRIDLFGRQMTTSYSGISLLRRISFVLLSVTTSPPK